MTTNELETFFIKYADSCYLREDSVPAKYKVASRRDLCAFILLDALVPGKRLGDMVSAAEHDEIYLAVDPEELAASAVTEEDIKALVGLGVSYDSGLESFRMGV